MLPQVKLKEPPYLAGRIISYIAYILTVHNNIYDGTTSFFSATGMIRTLRSLRSDLTVDIMTTPPYVNFLTVTQMDCKVSYLASSFDRVDAY